MQVGFFMVLGAFFKVPGWFSWFLVVFHVFDSSRSGFHDSRWIFIVINCSRLIFHDYRWAFMVIYGSRLVFMVIHDSMSVFHDSTLFFLWFFIVPGWFKSELRW